MLQKQGPWDPNHKCPMKGQVKQLEDYSAEETASEHSEQQSDREDRDGQNVVEEVQDAQNAQDDEFPTAHLSAI